MEIVRKEERKKRRKQEKKKKKKKKERGRGIDSKGGKRRQALLAVSRTGLAKSRPVQDVNKRM